MSKHKKWRNDKPQSNSDYLKTRDLQKEVDLIPFSNIPEWMKGVGSVRSPGHEQSELDR